MIDGEANRTDSQWKQKIESVRPTQLRPSPWTNPRVLQSLEPSRHESPVPTTTVFLTGAECPFRCAMCDLWKFTSRERTPEGAIPFQLSRALSETKLQSRHWLKLYNASNFFDDRSVPKSDLAEIARLCEPFERVIVENHPRFCDERMRWFAENIPGQLEVAMGLETVHPDAMQAMNKGMTLSDFDRAVEQCDRMKIDVRVFVLVHPPGVPIQDTIEWTWKTVAYAIQLHVRHISIIPMRSGNGWIDRLIEKGDYQLPTMEIVWSLMDKLQSQSEQIHRECTLELDLWDWDLIPGGCATCKSLLKECILKSNTAQKFQSLERSTIRCECAL